MTDTSEDTEVDIADPPAPLKPRHGVKVVRSGLRALWLLLTLPLVVLLLLAALLIDKDVTAPSWVKSRVQERAALILSGGSLAFGEITVNVGRDLHPRVRLVDTVLRDAQGAVLAEVDEISGLMSPRGLVLEQAALMQEVDLVGVAVTLNRSADGTVALAFDQNATTLEAAPSLTALIEQSESVFERPALQAMEQVRVSELAVTFKDARADQTWLIESGTLALDLRDESTTVTGDLPVQTGETVTQLSLAFESPRNSAAASATVSVSNVASRDIATQSPALNWLSAIDAPISATISTRLDADGTLQPVVGTLSIAAGSVRSENSSAPIGFDVAEVALTFDPATQVTTFTGFDFASDQGSFAGSGQIIVPDVSVGLPNQFVGQFAFEKIAIDRSGFGQGPLLLASANIDARVTLQPLRIDVGQVVIDDPAVALQASGVAFATSAGWQVEVDAAASSLSGEALYALWPESVKPRTRDWFVNNVTGAQFRDLSFAMRQRPNVPLVVAAGFGFDGADLRFMRSMPNVTGGSGFASLADNSMAISIDRGQLAAPEGGVVDIAGSTLLIEDVRRRDNRMALSLKTKSSITAALSLLDQEPMRVMSRTSRTVAIADGRAVLAGEISFPLGRRPKSGEVQYDMGGVLTRVSSDLIVPDRRLEAAELRVAATNTSLRFDGAATVDGIPVNGRYALPIGDAFNGQSTLEVEVAISPRALDVFDIALPPGTVTGQGRGTLSLVVATGRPPAFSLRSNLRGIRVAIPAIGWAKDPSAEGSLLVAGTLGDQPNIETLEVGGGGLTARGRVSFKANGDLDAARFSTLRLSNWLDAPLTLRGRGKGRPVGVEIAGGALDLRRARFGGSGQESGPLSLALDVLQITDGIALTEFRGDFNGSGGFSGQFRGRVNGAAVIEGTVAPQNGRSAVRLVTNDAGGAVRAAGFLNNAVGGTLDLTLLPAREAGNFDGNLAVRGLRVRDAPAIAALLDAISVVGLLQQLDGQGLSFETVDARFRLTPRQVVVTESSAVGPGLGISLDGVYTLASKSVDFQGVVSPFYLVNQIGSVLTRRGEGLIGFNFNIRGTTDNPSVSVNPLSALTPGMFREIFRRAPPQVSE